MLPAASLNALDSLLQPKHRCWMVCCHNCCATHPPDRQTNDNLLASRARQCLPPRWWQEKQPPRSAQSPPCCCHHHHYCPLQNRHRCYCHCLRCHCRGLGMAQSPLCCCPQTPAAHCRLLLETRVAHLVTQEVQEMHRCCPTHRCCCCLAGLFLLCSARHWPPRCWSQWRTVQLPGRQEEERQQLPLPVLVRLQRRGRACQGRCCLGCSPAAELAGRVQSQLCAKLCSDWRRLLTECLQAAVTAA